MLLVLIAAAAVGIVAAVAFGSPFADKPVTKKQIEARVTKRTRGNVQLTLCNEEILPSETPQPKNVQMWTCDTYIGPSKAEAQNGPSYAVTVKDGDIASIRRVPVH
jgi:Na+/glutamate symporter